MSSTQWMPSNIYGLLTVPRAEVRLQSITNSLSHRPARWEMAALQSRHRKSSCSFVSIWWAGAELGLGNSPRVTLRGATSTMNSLGLLRSDLCLKVWPHSHLRGLSPLWIPWCWMKPVLPGKAVSHSVHLWSPPPWIPRCFVRTALRIKAFPRSAH